MALSGDNRASASTVKSPSPPKTPSPLRSPPVIQLSPKGGGPPLPGNFFWTDIVLRVILIVSSVASLATAVSGNQTKVISSPLLRSPVYGSAKVSQSSAVMYFLLATLMLFFYSFLTTAFVYVLGKACPPTRLLLVLSFFDAMMAALMASAIGAACTIAYIGLRGDPHVGWHKVCNVFQKFCYHVGIALALNVAATWVLLILVIISTYSLYRRIS